MTTDMTVVHTIGEEEHKCSSSSFIEILEMMLQESFPNNKEKQRVTESEKYYSFACPVCRDSLSNFRKKRGILYKSDLFYKCYNCGFLGNVLKLFNKINYNIDTLDISNIYDIIKNKKESIYSNLSEIDVLLSSIDGFERFPLLTKFIDTLELIPAFDCETTANYLLNRLQDNRLKNLYTDSYCKRIYILNIVNERVLGYQIRNIGDAQYGKYFTHKASTMYEKHPLLFDDVSENTTNIIKKFDRVSTTFGISSLDLNEPVFVFEGPFDSFLLKNSVAVCSAQNDIHFECNRYYFFDYDSTGRNIMKSKLETGKYNVFLWQKFLDDFYLKDNKKWDLSDVLMFFKKNKKEFPNTKKLIAEYFSNSVYDIIWI